MMQTLGEFLSPEAGQARRKWLDESLGQFIPPELRGWVGAGAELNPVTNMERASIGAKRVADPSLSGWDRMAAAGDTAVNMASVLAPVAGAKMAGTKGADAIVEALTAASPMKGAVDDFMVDEFGGVGFGDEVATRGAQIMDMLRSGRAADVTDAMLDMGDPVLNARLNEYLFRNYDLPMDFESRMARAGVFDADLLHGTAGADYVAMREGGQSLPVDRAIWMSTTAEGGPNFIAASRMESAGQDSGRVIPLRARMGNNLTVDAAGKHAVDVRGIRGAADEGYDSVTLQNVREFGSPDATTSVAIFDPRNIRSRFARFDPRLAHLRNLSAGLGIPLAAYLGQDPETLGSYLEAQ